MGEAHNQRVLDNGRIADEKFDWPLSTIKCCFSNNGTFSNS